MRASVIVPVWNGSTVIGPCLDAVFARSGTWLTEVLCVDNASSDDSAALIRTRHPGARLLDQPVNLGFAGGVNAGIDAAAGDVLVLLNQDTIVEAGWLDALIDGLQERAAFGIAGATILDPGGDLNHAGAFVRHPDAAGVHVTTLSSGPPHVVDYVTGAAMAITRTTWDAVGRFDEGYYPAYYEDADYCYRASHHGIRTAYVPAARVVHLQVSTQPACEPIRVATNHHFVRYRFVAKHWEAGALAEFFAAEHAALDADSDFGRVVGRVLAARDLLRRLDDALACRQRDLATAVAPARRRQLQVGFATLLRSAMVVAERQGAAPTGEPDRRPRGEIEDEEVAILQHLRRHHDNDLATPPLQRFLRALLLQPFRVLTGREHALLARLAALQRARLDALEVETAGLRLLRILAEYDER
jgi:GT2 family glycosyltransferase